MDDRTTERAAMVTQQIERRNVQDLHVLEAMRDVPREAFVGPDMAQFAYEDRPLPIGEGQTISQPYIVGLMIEAAEVRPGETVLEIGLGSGYATAVLSRIADSVYAIERHDALTQTARKRLSELGYDNVTIRTGDGTGGWEDAGPFDAILVAAGAPSAPASLKRQLAVGGVLVIPVQQSDQHQTLTRIRRTAEDAWETEQLGAVRFVPLIGAEGWTEDGQRVASNDVPARDLSLPDMISHAAEPLPDPDDPGFGALFDRYGNSRVVLLGEASHGTSEFYRARAAITRHLIENHSFSIVAVEADWPDAAVIDRHVRQRESRPLDDVPFSRFPTWMWRNTDVRDFVDWLHDHNDGLETERQVAFHGLDIYNMGASIAAVLDYLDNVDPDAAEIARERYGCITPWQSNPAAYGRAALSQSYRDCEADVVAQLQSLLERQLDDAENGAGFLDAAQNARLIRSAEQYYKAMYYGGAESWNLRDSHMFETLEHVLKARGPDAKAVVWAHNSHIGDARATDMGAARGEHNIGQLARERFGDKAALIGFGTHCGTVAAATDWNGEMQIKRVRPSKEGSYERLCHDAGLPRFLLDLHRDPALRTRLEVPRLERFIGVIYRPETELQSHYAEASLPRQFDAFVWFDKTNAVTPLGPEHRRDGMPETYPFGV
ncbi:protein-L-isoaspartate(D-aspartate) O-methyltransferase [Loktanella sp. SALINAS62]|uniref:protein-L-isoaspartate(D-aspartate) O-methyltransferase n=1 Tax=Loktanella sp. SALINAS62 TaxID=2706124 RepID=UPI001B8D125C|nr:protein-L-isoaspartate(D-aspartate) O-methyltransferase [Loktanella sp. SALINAS62]MBS1302622.1 protein-L-isoaspartate(D-aspartate) O-methyltransferase [Loktanella sp. SALINAS62]